MKPNPHILVVARTDDPHRQAEALRAALGLTLRGARVEVILAQPPATPLAIRAATTLQSFGYSVETIDAGGDVAAAIRRADAVEVWT